MKGMIIRTLAATALLTFVAAVLAGPTQDGKGKYAEVNGLKMYYEIHGSAKPLVVLHGAFGWATVYPTLAKNRQIIAIELQGHGHTADIDRPLTVEQMADDTAALLKNLKIEQADFFGYSMGGNVALAVAIRHPNLVRKLVTFGSHYGKLKDAYHAEVFAQFMQLSPDTFAPKELKGDTIPRRVHNGIPRRLPGEKIVK